MAELNERVIPLKCRHWKHLYVPSRLRRANFSRPIRDFPAAARIASGVTSAGAQPFSVSLAATRKTASFSGGIVMLGLGEEVEVEAGRQPSTLL